MAAVVAFQSLLTLPARAADAQTLTLIVPFSARSGPDRAIRVVARV